MSNPLEKYFEDKPELTTFVFAVDSGLPYWIVANLRSGRKPAPSVSEAFKIAKATNEAVPVKAWDDDEDAVVTSQEA
ncbi:MAG: hypothetical protein PF495_06025 [Spirochaetales bacterium]|jgi:hypothetical protein|nr:hypothetical protein [Spirochaetales bacterium]